MGRVILRRLLALPVMLLIVSAIVTGMTLLIPGDPAVTLAGENATPEQVRETRDRLGLERPLVEQYADWVSGAVRGDLGQSLFSQREVADVVAQRLPVTASLTLGALVVAVVVGVPAGVVAGLRRGSTLDRVVTAVASLGISVPSYWLGLILLLVFAVSNRWLPSIGYVPFGESPGEWARHLVLPSVALGASAAAEVARQLRSSMADVLHQDYVRTARAKGMRGRTVVLKHALKNAAAPALTVLGLQVALLLGGAVVIEQIFGIPGLGQLAITAVVDGDVPLIQGIVLAAAVATVTVNLVVDLAYGWLDPRVRAS